MAEAEESHAIELKKMREDALARSEAEAEARLSADLTRMRAEIDAFLAAKGQKAKGPTKAPPSVGVPSAPNTARRPDSARKSSPKRAGKK